MKNKKLTWEQKVENNLKKIQRKKKDNNKYEDSIKFLNFILLVPFLYFLLLILGSLS